MDKFITAVTLTIFVAALVGFIACVFGMVFRIDPLGYFAFWTIITAFALLPVQMTAIVIDMSR